MNTATFARPSRAALALAFGTIYLAWGSTYLGMKIAVESLPPFAMASARFVLAGAVLFVVSRVCGQAAPTMRQWRENTLVGTLLLLGGNGLVAWAGQFMPSGVLALLLAASPLFMVLVGWAWPGGTRPTSRVLVGLLVGLAGAAWLAAPWRHAGDGGWPVSGLCAALGACVTWAIGSIASHRSRAPAPVLVAAAVQMLAGGAALAITSVACGELAGFDIGTVSRASLGAWLHLFVVSVVAFPTYAWLMRNSTPARVSTYAYVNPVVAVILGWLWLGESMGGHTIAAAVVILAAVIVVKVPSHRLARRRAGAAPRRRPASPAPSWLRTVAARLSAPDLSKL
ncbi:MAG: EamA family transporter [Opitutaceae bacterium]|nr:EamA family transporter [Opitutaceae bacterium]